MYYVWQKNKKLVGESAHFDDDPDGYELTDWVSGDRKTNLPKLTLTTNSEYESKLTDLLLTRFDLQVYSKKLVDILNVCGVNNVDYYPVKIIKHDTGEEIDTYQAANIVGKVACLDENNSKCRYSSKTGAIQGLKKFRLNEESIKSKSEIGSEPLLFRLGEFKYVILAHEIIKNRIEDEGVTGVKFVKPENYI